VLTTRNALIGQPVADFATLVTMFDEPTLRQLASDRTADSSTVALYWSRPVGEHWQMYLDGSHSRLSSTVASGGVEGTPSSRDSGLGLQMIGTGLWKPGDVWIMGLRGQHGDNSDTTSAFLSTRASARGCASITGNSTTTPTSGWRVRHCASTGSAAASRWNSKAATSGRRGNSCRTGSGRGAGS
jgi:hypothetical protein